MSSLKNRLESRDNIWVELARGALAKATTRFGAGQRGAIRPVRGHCVVRVSYSQYSGDHGNLLSGQPVGISTAVPSLMVMSHDNCDFGVIIDIREDAFANLR